MLSANYLKCILSSSAYFSAQVFFEKMTYVDPSARRISFGKFDFNRHLNVLQNRGRLWTWSNFLLNAARSLLLRREWRRGKVSLENMLVTTCTALRRIVHSFQQVFFSKYSRHHTDLKHFQIKVLTLFSHVHFLNGTLRALQRPWIIIHCFEQLKSNYLRFNYFSEGPIILCLCSNHCVFNPEYSEIMNYVWYLMYQISNNINHMIFHDSFFFARAA